jgi:hypothetical protein
MVMEERWPTIVGVECSEVVVEDIVCRRVEQTEWIERRMWHVADVCTARRCRRHRRDLTVSGAFNAQHVTRRRRFEISPNAWRVPQYVLLGGLQPLLVHTASDRRF